MPKEYIEAFELVKRTCELYIQSASHLIGADIIGNKIDEAVDTIKQVLLKQQESKKYLKWEDLDFTDKIKTLWVKLGDNTYKMQYYKPDPITKTVVLYSQQFIEIWDAKFFNDLHLEVIKDE